MSAFLSFYRLWFARLFPYFLALTGLYLGGNTVLEGWVQLVIMWFLAWVYWELVNRWVRNGHFTSQNPEKDGVAIRNRLLWMQVLPPMLLVWAPTLLVYGTAYFYLYPVLVVVTTVVTMAMAIQISLRFRALRRPRTARG